MARAVMAVAFVALLSLILHAHVNYDLYLPGILIPASFLLAVWYLASERAQGMDRRILWRIPADWRPFALACLIFTLILAGQWPARVGLTSYAFQGVYKMERQGDYEGAATLLDKMARFGIGSNFSVPEAQAQLVMRRLHGVGDADKRADMIRQGLAYIQEARRDNPAFSGFMSLEAQFYFIGNGSVFPDGLDKAFPILQQAVKDNPLDLDAREGLAVVYQAKGQPDEALRILNEGLNWPRVKGRPDLDFLMMTARAHEKAGDAEGAKMLTDMAEQRAQSYGLSLRR
jgi:tetratricopeptide (TPR) repeat protein